VGFFLFLFFLFPHAPDLPRSVLRKTQLPTPPSYLPPTNYLPKPQTQTPFNSFLSFRALPCSLMFFCALEAPSCHALRSFATLPVLLQKPAITITRGRVRSKEPEDTTSNSLLLTLPLAIVMEQESCMPPKFAHHVLM
jgi:hypothetical protein